MRLNEPGNGDPKATQPTNSYLKDVSATWDDGLS